jgi:hypothetical protein
MRLLALSCVLFLTACGTTTVPVSRKFPELPPVLREECQELVKLEKKDDKPLSIIDLLGTNIENYRRGVECKVKHSATIQWHDTQKQLFDDVK